MSASREKKARQERNASGYVDPKLTEKKKEAAKDKRSTGLVTALLAVVVIGAIALAVVNSGVLERSKVAATIDGENYSVSDVSYYFNSAYNSFISSNSSYLTSYGLDTSLPLRDQESPLGGTWFEYFADQALNSMATVKKLVAAAEAEGFDASEAMDEAEKDALETIASYASTSGYTTKQYLKALFGSFMTEKDFVRCVREAALADAYTNAYTDNLTFTDDQLKATYETDPKAYETVDIEYILYTFTAEEGATDEEKAASLAEIEQQAQTALDRYAAGEDLEAISDETGSFYHHSAYTANGSSDMISWAFDDARVAGDTTTVTSGESSCYAVVFHSRSLNDYHPVSVRHILVADEATAESVLAEYEAGEKTEEAFAALAQQYSTDNANAGGLYEDIYKGQMVESFEAWCFDPARKVGDTGIVESDYGYHVMYFVSANDSLYWQVQAADTLKDVAYAAWYSEIVGEPEIVAADGMDLIG